MLGFVVPFLHFQEQTINQPDMDSAIAICCFFNRDPSGLTHRQPKMFGDGLENTGCMQFITAYGIIEYNYCSDLSGYAVFSALIMEKNPHFRW